MHDIVYIVTSLSTGGAETQVVELVKRLSESKKIGIITLIDINDFKYDLKDIDYYSLKMTRKIPNPIAIIKLIRILNIWKPLLIHSHMIHPNLLIRTISFIHKTPSLICTIHNIDNGRRWRDILYRISDRHVNINTAISQTVMESMIRRKIVKRDKIIFIVNGIDLEKFKFSYRTRKLYRSKYFNDNIFLWVAVGRFDKQKDYQNLINAAQILFTFTDIARLIICGKGPLYNQYYEEIEQLNLQNKILLLGHRNDIPEIMNSADGYVMSSAWEGLPLVLLEACASQLICVATNVGGNNEIIKHGENGFIVPPKNPKMLADAMLKSMKLPKAIRKTMAKYGRINIENNYDINKITIKWEKLYNKYISK